MSLETPPPGPLRRRADGWTPRRQSEFLAVLAQTRNISRAARAVGLSTTSAYKLRRHPAAHDFAVAWDAALAWRRAP